MKLHQAIERYIAWRRIHGAKFKASAQHLRQFSNSVERDIDCKAVSQSEVCRFLAGNRPLTKTRSHRYSALRGFYRYAIARGYTTVSPLPDPDQEPRPPQSKLPHVFSPDQLQRMFGTIDQCHSRRSKLDAFTFRTLLLLLCGSGLRIGEALQLTLTDINLQNAVLTVRDSKFYKSRLVPIGPQLNALLSAYAKQRVKRTLPNGKNSTFLAYIDGSALTYKTVDMAFSKLRDAVPLCVIDRFYQRPTLHSFRHTFAVHRLTDWYRQGADVQRLLPLLSNYLGHSSLQSTQIYLSVTPQLLQHTSVLFNQYVNGDHHE